MACGLDRSFGFGESDARKSKSVRDGFLLI